MLNPFPDLLVLSFFAPTLLRLCAGVAFIYLAYQQYVRRREIGALRLPLFWHLAAFPVLAATFHTLVGAALVVGYYTQVAALLGVVALLKGLWLNKRYPHIVILPNSTVVVLLLICLSLLLTGAGALAFDLRL